MEDRKLYTNLDTSFLKLIAMVSMTIDHIGTAFFPDYPIFRWIGRLAFPIYCYCLTVGLLYTRDIKKYLARLGIFAVISQPLYVLAFHPNNFLENIGVLNIFFTLFMSLLALHFLSQRKWWMFAVVFIAVCLINFDYSALGIQLMLIFYFFRKKLLWGLFFYMLSYLPALYNGYIDDPLALVVGSHAIGFEIFSLLAIPFIFLHTNFKLNIPKWFYYVYYPVHLLVIYLVRIMIE